MNQMQLKYARHRAQEMLQTKIQTLTQKHTIKGQPFTDKQRLEALRAGEFTVVDKVVRAPKRNNQRPWEYDYEQMLYYSGTWSDHIQFTNEVRTSVDYEAIETERKALQTSFDTLMDELMLGDYAEALALLKQFEAL